MLKRSVIFIVFFLSIQFGYTQDILNDWLIYCHAGSAIAIDNLGKKVINDNKSGFGAAGYYAAVGIEIPLNKKTGFFTELNGQLIDIARKSMASQLNQTSFYQGVYALSSSLPTVVTLIDAKKYPNWNVKKSDWRSATLMLGVTRKIPLFEKAKLNLIIKCGMGFLYARSPVLYGQSINDSTTATIEQNSGKALGFAARLGMTVEHQLNPKLKIRFNNDFDLSGNVKFKDITATTTTTQGRYGSSNFIFTKSWVSGNLLQQINAIHLSLGIAYEL